MTYGLTTVLIHNRKKGTQSEALKQKREDWG